MDVYEATTKRRSIRKYQNKPVPYNVLEKCVDAARMAPNGHNHQIFEYIIVDGEPKLAEVLACIGLLDGKMPDSSKGKVPEPEERPLPGEYPKACIIPLINKTLETATGVPRWAHMIAVGMLAENAILVALENGVGACPMMGFNADELRKVLNLPDNYDVGMMITLGYPAESPVAEESTGSIERWRDDRGVYHIPKRRLKDILHRNEFPGK